MSLRSIFLLVVLGAVLSGCRRVDYRDVTIEVPEMKNAACEEVIRHALRAQVAYGVDVEKMVFDLTNRTVRLSYDSVKLSLKNVEFTFAEAGFGANDVPASTEARAKLPPACL